MIHIPSIFFRNYYCPFKPCFYKKKSLPTSHHLLVEAYRYCATGSISDYLFGISYINLLLFGFWEVATVFYPEDAAIS